MKIEKNVLPKSQVELKVSLTGEEFDAYHAKAFAVIQKDVEIDGFRKGNAPENLVVKKYGDMLIVEEMANLAIRDAYMQAVEDHKLNPIAQPEVTVTKIARGNPFEVTLVVFVMPDIELPEYKKLAQGVKVDEKAEVAEKDIDDVIEELRKGRAQAHHHDHDHDHEGHDHEGHDHDHAHDHAHDEKAVLPEVDDAFAQSFGQEFKSVADLRGKIKENLSLEKEQKIKEKRRTAMIDAITEKTTTELPEVVVEGELENMLSQMKYDITRFGGTWEEYLEHSKKTEEELKAGWRDDAYKRALSQLVLHKIAQVEKLQATEAEVEAELVRLLATVQDANEERAKGYLYQVITNDKVLRFLEEDKK